jgi:hypothetical protein
MIDLHTIKASANSDGRLKISPALVPLHLRLTHIIQKTAPQIITVVEMRLLGEEAENIAGRLHICAAA